MRRHAAANRERILVAAEEVFGAEGGQGSTEEVARRADVGIATVFRHFPTKEALIEAALLRHFARLHEQAAALREHADAGEALREMVTTMVDTGASKITLAGLLLEGAGLPEPVRVAAAALRDVVAEVLDRAHDAGVVDPAVTVDEVYFLVRGLAQASATMPAPVGTVRGAVDVVLRGLTRSDTR